MAVEKVAVTIDGDLLKAIDQRVAAGRFRNRSRAVQEGLRLLIEREGRPRLLAELAKLDPQEEQALANEAMTADVPWPES
jgi:putative addiction module CopG family antidote